MMSAENRGEIFGRCGGRDARVTRNVNRRVNLAQLGGRAKRTSVLNTLPEEERDPVRTPRPTFQRVIIDTAAAIVLETLGAGAE